MEKGDWLDKMTQIQTDLGNQRLEYWRSNVLFSFNWWLLLLYFGLFWFIWWKVADRRKLPELLGMGGFVLVLSLLLDSIGAELGFWDYPMMVLPWGPRLMIVDAALPIFYMLLYQYAPDWKRYTACLLLMSLFFSFVLEPFMVKVEVYRPILWKHFFSVPGYFVLGLAARWFSVYALRLFGRWERDGDWKPQPKKIRT